MLEFLRKQLDELLEKRKKAVEARDASLEAAKTESRGLSEDEKAVFEGHIAEVRGIDAEIEKAEAQFAEAEAAEARAAKVAEQRVKYQSVNVQPGNDPFEMLSSNVPTTRQQRGDALIRVLEKRISSDNQAHVERVIRRHAGDVDWSRNLLARSTPAYESGFAKLMTGNTFALTNEERAAVAVGTATQGGSLVPTYLDPTLILTNTGSANAIRPLARTATLTTGNTWHGVTTAGVTASFDAELSEVSDDSPSFGAPSVPLFTARAFVQASYEAFEDIANLGDDVLMLFADARDRLEGAMHANGTGSGQPHGVFNVLAATAGHQTVSTTAAAIGLVDLQAVYFALGQRWRNSGTWVMNPTYLLAIQALGTALSASYTTNLTESLTDRLIGRPVVTTDDAPATQTTTTKDAEVLIGNFSNFLIVDKPGSMSVEFIPQLFNTGNNLPTGGRGWIAHWRNGSEVLNSSAFQLLVDKTTA